MKQLLTICLFIFATLYSAAIETNELFGFSKQPNSEDYQQYVGAEFRIRNSVGKKESWSKTGCYPSSRDKKYDFVISKITVKDDTIKGNPTRLITVIAVQPAKHNWISFSAYDNKPDSKEIEPQLDWLPIVFTKPFEEFKEKVIGTELSHPLVRETYTVTDAYIDTRKTKQNTAYIALKIKSNTTGEISDTPYHSKDITPFKKYLEKKHYVCLKSVSCSDKNYVVSYEFIDDQYCSIFADNNINIVFFSTPTEINFILQNNSTNTIKILWNNASFAGIAGFSSRIIHNGVKFSQKDEPMMPTSIIPGAKLIDQIFPADNIILKGYKWNVIPMYNQDLSSFDNGTIKILLPIQIEDEIIDYIFEFGADYINEHPKKLNKTPRDKNNGSINIMEI